MPTSNGAASVECPLKAGIPVVTNHDEPAYPEFYRAVRQRNGSDDCSRRLQLC